MISHIAFEETTQTQVAAIVQNLQYTQYFTLLILNASTGSIDKSFKDLVWRSPEANLADISQIHFAHEYLGYILFR
jgi:hypothetical protein